ncbi:MAG: hypothetical protein ACUVXA_18550, partial [Candidatus Jordarchaeum sp.]|uniref:hypothetical protein n=1 Tax=Candidatus Jordarchaeum sp. TaxID=2823881 RepID=UPI00404930B7
MRFIFMCITFLLFVNFAFCQEEQPAPPPGMRATTTNFPDVSFVGDITGKVSDNQNDTDRNKILVREVELALQGYIYPQMRADIFLAMHRHEEETVAEICEGYVSFLNIGKGFSLKVGKIHIDFGKINKIHSHHRPYADQPDVITNFLGDHGLVGQGAVLSYLLPTKKFVQFDLGTWYIESHHHHHDEENHTEEFSLADKVHTAKLSISNPLSEISELEIGLNFAKGKGAHFKEHKDNTEVYGIDLTYKSWPHAHKRILFQNELFWLKREVPIGEIKRSGFYSFANYKINKYYDFGIRYDNTEDAFPHNDDVNIAEKSESVSVIGTKNLTETTRLRLQYRYDIKNKKNLVYLQLQFGIGPHSHPLE